MRTRLVDHDAFTVAGLAVDTSQATQAADAGPILARLFDPGFAGTIQARLDPEETFALHSDFNPDGETYRLTLGWRVDPAARQPAGVAVVTVPAARFTVLAAEGPQPQASMAAWEHIRTWRGRGDVVRTGAISFERHDARTRGASAVSEIFIPAVAG